MNCFVICDLLLILFLLVSGGSRGGSRGAQEPPFGLHDPILRSTDDKLKGTPLSGYRTKKTAAMAHLRML